MTIQVMETDDFLAHYGVKGMKWGVLRARTPAEKKARALKKVNKQISNIDMNVVLNGYALQGGAMLKIDKKLAKKDPNYLKKMTKEERFALSNKARRRATRNVLLVGTAEVGVILAGGNLAMSKIEMSPSTAHGAQIVTAFMATQTAAMHIQDLYALNQAKQFDYLRRQRTAIENKKFD